LDYDLVYDAAKGNFEGWSFIAMGALFIIIGAILVFSENVREIVSRKRSKDSVLLFSKVFFGFSILWTVLAGSAVFLDNGETKSSSQKNTCTTIEGEVEGFEPMPSGGYQFEKFVVNKTEFEYSDYVLNGGFNNTSSHGGPIIEGLKVRICYFYRVRTNSNVIVRLEVSR